MTKMVNVKVNGRWDIKLPEHRAARPEWTSENGWEKARLEAMHTFVSYFNKKRGKKPVCYYVGAEEGDMCALAQIWGAELVMFEPNPAVWANIKGIWDANKLPDPYFCLDGFAGNENSFSGDIDFSQERKWPAFAEGEMIAEHGFKNLCEADGTIPIVKIDTMAETLMPPDFISIDVEGAEWEVLRGAQAVLHQYHPTIFLSLHPEFMYEIYKEYGNDLRYWLKQMGYIETLLDYQHEVHLLYTYEGAND